jgi:ABC-type glycerol-3-phosphate transport system permease component
VGFLVAFLLTSVSPRKTRPPVPVNLKEETVSAEERKTAADAFFWILIMVLVFLAFSHYYWYPQLGWY